MDIAQIENGKSPDEPYNARLGFWLPPDSPYGNLTLKLMKLCERLDEANRRLRESWIFWDRARQPLLSVNALQRHVYANEQAVYLIRRATDEIISLIWCLSEKEATGKYPEQIKVDCIGAVMAKPSDQRLAPFRRHEVLFLQLNEIANAFKHSFVNSDLTVIGRDEPSVYALSLDRNRLSAGVQFHSIALRSLVDGFNAFYAESMAWLREFSDRNRQPGGAASGSQPIRPETNATSAATGSRR